MDVALGFLAGGIVGILVMVAGLLTGARLARLREIDPREVQRRTEGRGR